MSTLLTYQPDYLSPPGDTLLDLLDEREMSQTQLAERSGLTKKTINEIVKGKAPITPETSIAFETIFGIQAEFWTNREQNYRRGLLLREQEAVIEDETEWVSTFPYNDMAKQGWVPAIDGRSTGAVLNRGIALLRFFAVKSPNQWRTIYLNQSVSFRKPLSFSSDPAPLSAWLRQGEIEAQRLNIDRAYDKDLFVDALTRIRSFTTELPSQFCEPMTKACAQSGVALVFTPQIPKASVSGAARWLKDRPLIQVSLRYRYSDHFWFTFFHEAAHILRHGKKEVFIDMKTGGPEIEIKKEEEANRYSRDILIPPQKYADFLSSSNFSATDIIEFARQIGVYPGIVVGRLQHDDKLDHWQYNDLRPRYDWTEN